MCAAGHVGFQRVEASWLCVVRRLRRVLMYQSATSTTTLLAKSDGIKVPTDERATLLC